MPIFAPRIAIKELNSYSKEIMSKYLMKSAAAIVLGLAATACSHDLDIVEKAEQQSLDNAQATLGFYIPENQDWKMSSEASVNVTIPGDANQTYTVMVYANNPLEDGIGYYLTKQTMNGGQNLVTDISYPAHLKSLVIGIKDSNGQKVYKFANIENGQITSLSDISAARTRQANSSRTRGNYANGNHWGATAESDPDDPQRGWIVPDTLNDGQRLRVTRYFQTHPYLTYEDPHWTNFFVQQVYTGGKNVLEGTEPYKNKDYAPSPEVYRSADKLSTEAADITSDKLNYLFAYGETEHINNFNAATASYKPVLETGEDVNNGKKHDDRINLMANSSTYDFSYQNAYSSVRHGQPYVALVSAKTIDEWADSVQNAYNIIIGEPVYYGTSYSGKPNSYWNRSFLGCDLELLIGEEIYDGSNMKLTDASSFGATGRLVNGEWEAGIPQGEYLYDEKPVRYLKTDQNQYGGDLIKLNDSDICYDLRKQWTDEKGNHDEYLGKVLNTAKFEELLGLGYLPVAGTNLKNWVKPHAVADHYYSDWIVTLYEAKRQNETEEDEPAVWSYAFEDNRVRCDFDMNDVVLRVNVNKTDPTKFDVTLVAAGCEYDNYVFLGGQVITWPNGKTEVHDALGAAKGQMVNTGRGVTKPSVTTTVSIPSGDTAENAHFSIWPYKKGGEYGNVEDQKEEAAIGISTFEGKGKAPLGIVVPGKWAWPKERICIVDAYSRFVQWASSVTHITGPTEDEGGWYDYPTTDQVIVMP